MLSVPAIAGVFSFATGACIASFLNVVIWRVPRGESIVAPPSHCPKCGAAIRWWRNIPILSWLALRGRCANCRAPISPRYILVEALGGALFLAAFFRYDPVSPFLWTPSAAALLVAWIWISLMMAGSFIDIDHKLLPDFVTVGGMALGVGYGLFKCIVAGSLCGWSLDALRPLAFSLSGLVFGFGLLWLVRFLGTKAFRREAMGMGDVFLMGAVGAIFGPVAVLATLILSAVAGSAVGLAGIAAGKLRLGRFAEIPYGPFICLGCLAWMFRGPELVDWYLGICRIAAAHG